LDNTFISREFQNWRPAHDKPSMHVSSVMCIINGIPERSKNPPLTCTYKNRAILKELFGELIDYKELVIFNYFETMFLRHKIQSVIVEMEKSSPSGKLSSAHIISNYIVLKFHQRYKDVYFEENAYVAFSRDSLSKFYIITVTSQHQPPLERDVLIKAFDDSRDSILRSFQKVDETDPKTPMWTLSFSEIQELISAFQTLHTHGHHNVVLK